MSTRKVREIRQSLLAKGFHQQQSHHEMYWFEVDGKRTSVRTRLSHGAKEYDDRLLALMSRQLHLTRKEFERLVDCPMTGEEYRGLLIQRGAITIHL